MKKGLRESMTGLYDSVEMVELKCKQIILVARENKDNEYFATQAELATEILALLGEVE